MDLEAYENGGEHTIQVKLISNKLSNIDKQTLILLIGVVKVAKIQKVHSISSL